MTEIARERLLPRLDEPLPLIILEGVAGLGKRTLLRQWVADQRSDRVRALVEFDPRQPGQPAVLTQVLRALEHQQVPIAPDTYREAAAASVADDGSAILQSVIEPLGQVDLALVGGERLPASAFDAFTHAHRRLPGLRVALETTDAGPAVERAAADDLPLAVIGDVELALDLDEVAAMVAALDGEPAPAAAEALWRATRGHAGQVVAALRWLPQECLSGAITRPQVLRHWSGRADDPSVFERHLLQLARLPRFTSSQARHLTGQCRVRDHTRRMTALGLGDLKPAPGSAEPVFHWDEDARQSILRSVPDQHPEAGDLRAFADAASQAGDLDLAASALVQAGDLDAAEQTVRLGLSETLASAGLAVWQPLARIPHVELARRPALQLVRMVTGLRSGTASRRIADHLAGHADRLAARQCTEPIERLWLLALAARAACEAGRLGEALGHAQRWGRLAGDAHPILLAHAGQAVAMAMAMADLLVRVDELGQAAQVADLALELMDAGDQQGIALADSRRDTALRVRRCAVAVLDHAAPDDPAAAVVPLSGRALELDEVLVAVHEAWLRMDTGDLAGAEKVTGCVLQRVSRPGDWPVLLLTRAVALIGTRQRCALEQLRARYLADPQWCRRQFGPQRVGWIAAILDTLVPVALGRRAPGERPDHPDAGEVVAILRGYLQNQPRVFSADELEHLPRRARKLALSLKSLALARAGELEQAVDTFALLCGDLPETGALPLAFAFAQPDEVERLAAAHGDQSPACRGHLEYAREVASAMPNAAGTELTAREREILAQLRRGTPNRRIAEDLVVSVNTVKFHRANLYRKLGATTRTEALAAAVRLGF